MTGLSVQRGRGGRCGERLALGVLVFGLASCATNVQTAGAPVEPVPASRANTEPVPAAAAMDGAGAFRDTCAPCHGEDGRGGAGGGPPLDAVADPELIVAMVNYGRGSMPPLQGMLTNEQIRAVAAYVTTELFK
jgi:cytochrome c oxidase cbb3-type subunit 3